MISDFFIIFNWWFLLFGLGIAFLPLTRWFFKGFFDLGYGFSKIIAILLISYLVWLTGSLKILPFSVSSIWIIVILLAFFNFFLARKFRKEFLKQIKNCWKILVFEEILFFTALTFWSFIRGFQPDIEGLEKFMDFGFVNSILRSSYFPPLDIWMAGKTINYYYFGHLVTAVLTKISGIDPAITYNLMIATIFALSFMASFSLGTTLFSFSLNHQSLIINHKYKILLAGFLSATLLTLGGNLHAFWWFLTHNFNFAAYWYPDATRFIVEKFGALDNTIHEFPIYSFVVSDLHGHVSNIPFVLLFLATAFTIFASKKPSLYLYVFISLLLGVLYMTNSWDFPIYFLILGATIFYFNYLKYGFSFKSFLNIGLLVVLVLIGSILFSLPFHLHFSQMAKGIAPVSAHSPFWQLLVLWGYQWIIGLSFIVFLVLKKLRITNYPASAKASAGKQLQIPDIYILILFIIATSLIIIPEFFYVKDIYISSYHRANTMFKLVYQSFMMYGLASGYIIVRILTSLKKKVLKFMLFAFCFLLFTFVFIYPYFATNSYYGNLKIYHGLYGLSFLKRTSPDDYQAIIWLKENIKGQPVVLEASGDSYTLFNRVSALTGLPTIQGWLVHEWLWRGSFDEPGKRAGEVQTIYETKNKNQALEIIKKYHVEYIFVGEKEREKYKISEEKFAQIGEIVFQSGKTRIYKIELTNW